MHISLIKYVFSILQEDNQIYFMSIHDIEIGDVLKVWYAPTYAARMYVPLLQPSSHQIVNNILRQLSIDHTSLPVDSDSAAYCPETMVGYNSTTQTNAAGVSLPPIESIIKASYQKTDYSTSDQHMDAGNASTATTTSASTTNNSYNKTNNGAIMAPAQINEDELGLLNMSFDSTAFNSSRELDSSAGTSQNDTVTTESLVATPSDAVNAKDKANKKKSYRCEICDKKYATMTNIYKHMRSHDLYLCSLCMKTFSQEHEIKEHKCPQGSVKTPQCLVCFKYLSNSWSLTRHMKIHDKDYADAPADGVKLSDNVGVLGRSIGEVMVTVQESECSEATSCSLATTCSSEFSHTLDNDQVGAGATIGPMDEYRFECIVCAKEFTSSTQLNKHLRSIHTGKLSTFLFYTNK